MANHVQIYSIEKLNEVLADGERHDFFVALNGGLRSSKNIALADGNYCINNEIDDSHQDLSAGELMDSTKTIIGQAIAGGAFYQYSYDAEK